MQFDTRVHGAVPFWFWNGDQQEGELTRQLELTAAAGFKGLAIHARRGNKTEYMSGRWIELCRHCCREALRLGVDIWLYDEEGFPSGSVGGRLAKQDPSLLHKQIFYAYAKGADLADFEGLFAVYELESYRQVESRDVADEQEVLAFRVQVAKEPRFVDMLKRESVERFIEMTHKPYYAELKEFFGRPITHVYTDDLYSFHGFRAGLPYTEKLPEIVSQRLDVDFFEMLPLLVENLPGCAKARLDFRALVLELFLEEYVSPMHQWCDAHGVQFTGHLCGDEGPIDKTVMRLGSSMAFYEYEHIPGVDDFLCEMPDSCYLDRLRNPRNHCPVILFKQASSVANQLKGGACGAEVLTYLGWGASVAGQSAFLNYEMTLGVNLMTHHDFSYATEGVSKRDCPPSYFFQQPYWDRYPLLMDAAARSCQLLKRGKYDASVLVIHPVTSCWVSMDGGFPAEGNSFAARIPSPVPEPRAFEDGLAAVSHELLRLRVGFEYGEEGILGKHGRVEDGAIRVNDMTYTTVIIPEVCNLMESTVELLARLQAAGGRLIVLDPSDECLVDGVPPTAPLFESRLAPETVGSADGLRELGLRPTLELVTGEPHAPVVCHSRVVDGVGAHFVFNCSDRPQMIRWQEPLHVYDPRENVSLDVDDRELVLPPFHSIHLLHGVPAGVASKPVRESVFAVAERVEVMALAASAWRIVPDQPNLMLIDWCELTDGSAVYYNDPRAAKAGESNCRATVDVPQPEKVTAIMGESRTLRDMRVNGHPLPAAHAHHPSSQDMLIASLDGLLVDGRNELAWNGPDEEALFEPFYLMGDFGVELMATPNGMRPSLSSLRPGFGDLVDQGLPFYWGSIRFETELDGRTDAAWLDCGEVVGVLAVSVNGEEIGCCYDAPYRFHIGGKLREGRNKVKLTLYNTAQNLYGPHRGPSRDALQACTPRGVGDNAYMLAGFGIHGRITLMGSEQ